MATCPMCYAGFDLTALPTVETRIPQTAFIPSGKQCDKLCPRCGTLLCRTIDGVLVGKDYEDTRAERQAEKLAKVAVAKATKKPTDEKRKSASKK